MLDTIRKLFAPIFLSADLHVAYAQVLAQLAAAYLRLVDKREQRDHEARRKGIAPEHDRDPGEILSNLSGGAFGDVHRRIGRANKVIETTDLRVRRIEAVLAHLDLSPERLCAIVKGLAEVNAAAVALGRRLDAVEARIGPDGGNPHEARS
jgi:hypothetical protein